MQLALATRRGASIFTGHDLGLVPAMCSESFDASLFEMLSPNMEESGTAKSGASEFKLKDVQETAGHNAKALTK